FGIIAEQSIGTLFTAAIVPGVTQMLSYLLVVALIVRFRPGIAPRTPAASWPERRAALKRVADVGVLVVAVTGGIVFGVVTPSEAAAVGAAGAFAIALARRRLDLATLKRALEDTLRTTGLIYLVVIGALIFAAFIGVTGLTEAVGTAIAD